MGAYDKLKRERENRRLKETESYQDLAQHIDEIFNMLKNKSSISEIIAHYKPLGYVITKRRVVLMLHDYQPYLEWVKKRRLYRKRIAQENERKRQQLVKTIRQALEAGLPEEDVLKETSVPRGHIYDYLTVNDFDRYRNRKKVGECIKIGDSVKVLTETSTISLNKEDECTDKNLKYMNDTFYLKRPQRYLDKGKVTAGSRWAGIVFDGVVIAKYPYNFMVENNNGIRRCYSYGDLVHMFIERG